MTETNGHQPAAADTAADPAPAPVPVSERLLGLFGLAFALGVALIGADLLTGGALTRAFEASRAEAGTDER